MGDKDLRASANVSNRMLDRPAAVVKAGKGGGGADAQTRVASTLVDLRPTVTELDPNRADLGGAEEGAQVAARAATRSSATSPSTSRRSRT